MPEYQTLWTDEEVNNISATDTEILVSSDITNNNDLNSIKAVIEYKTITPDGENNLVGFALKAILEDEVATDIWQPLAVQHQGIKGLDQETTQILDLFPGFVQDQGIPEKVFAGAATSINRTEGTASDKMRVRIVKEITDSSKAQLTDIKVSGYVKKYNR